MTSPAPVSVLRGLRMRAARKTGHFLSPGEWRAAVTERARFRRMRWRTIEGRRQTGTHSVLFVIRTMGVGGAERATLDLVGNIPADVSVHLIVAFGSARDEWAHRFL